MTSSVVRSGVSLNQTNTDLCRIALDHLCQCVGKSASVCFREMETVVEKFPVYQSKLQQLQSHLLCFTIIRFTCYHVIVLYGVGGGRGAGCGRSKGESRGRGQGCCREGCCRESCCRGQGSRPRHRLRQKQRRKQRQRPRML